MRSLRRHTRPRSAFGDATLFLEPYAGHARHVEVQVFGDLLRNGCASLRARGARFNGATRRSSKSRRRPPSTHAFARTSGRLHFAYCALDRLRECRHRRVPAPRRSQLRLLGDEHPPASRAHGHRMRHGPRPREAPADGRRRHEAPSRGSRGADARPRDRGAPHAEDPTDNWRPSAGRLHRLFVPAPEAVLPDESTPSGYGPGGVALRLDSGVADGTEVSSHYDPLLAKVICHGASRREASRALARTLERAEIHGLRTNRDLLVRILRHEEFLEGDIDTGFLDRHDPALLGAPLATESAERLHAVAGALATQERRRRRGVGARRHSLWVAQRARAAPVLLVRVPQEANRGGLPVRPHGPPRSRRRRR